MTNNPRLHRVVAAQPYPLLFATISGAHLYGFPSPDSDFDLRGVHVLPLEEVIGLEVKDETIQQEMFVPPEPRREKSFSPGPSPGAAIAAPPSPAPAGEGRENPHPQPLSRPTGEGGTDAANRTLEMDIVSHDVRKFFGLLLKKNGYVLEQLFSPLVVHTTAEHEELKSICKRGRQSAHSPSGEKQRRLTSAATGVVTKHHAHHYFGFAETQWKLFLKESPRRVKPLLYVYRVLLTGIHLMRTGEIEANVVTLNEEFRLPYINDLVARKLAGSENLAVGQLLDSEIAFHEAEYQRLRGVLQSAYEASQLPELPSEETRQMLNDLLVRIRFKAARGAGCGAVETV